MKKLCLISLFGILAGFSTFGYNGEQEEIGFFLFLPNSSNQFADEDQAILDLDTAADFLLHRNPGPGQIHAGGYSADVVNDIDPVDLSRNRALFVISELQKRGISEELFADPVAFGAVDLWVSNTDEEARSPNRRVIVVLEPAPQAANIIEQEDHIPVDSHTTDQTGSRFPWVLLLILLIPALLAVLFLRGKKTRKPLEIAAVTAKPLETAVVTVYPAVNLDEEIRYCAYMLHLEREGRYGSTYEDWCKAVIEVCSRYEAAGHHTYMESGIWWAQKSN